MHTLRKQLCDHLYRDEGEERDRRPPCACEVTLKASGWVPVTDFLTKNRRTVSQKKLKKCSLVPKTSQEGKRAIIY